MRGQLNGSFPGGDVPEEQVGDGRAALGAGIPDVEDRRDVLGGPAQVERRPFITSSTVGVPVATTA